MEFTASNTETCTMVMIRCPVDPGPTFPTIAQALSFQSVTASARTRPGIMNAPTSAQPAATARLSDLFITCVLLELDHWDLVAAGVLEAMLRIAVARTLLCAAAP